MNTKKKVIGVAGVLFLVFFSAFLMMPGFGGVFVIVVLLAIAYLFMRQEEGDSEEVITLEQKQQ